MGIILASERPSRLTTEKDKEYYVKYARWCVSQSLNSAKHSNWIKNISINKRFYKNDQWIMQEDIETFLNDSEGNVRNRIKVGFNQIRPIVEQYRGNASILKINASAKSISKLSINRRELSLAKKITSTRLAAEFPGLGEIMKKNDPTIGENIQETSQIFENLYVDMFVPQLNALLKFGAENNKYQESQMAAALNLALSGLVAFECFNHGGHRKSELIQSENFFYDPDARKSNMEDASFMGYSKPTDISFIAEAYPNANPEDIKNMEALFAAMQNTNSGSYSLTKPEVFRVYWLDMDKWEYGYVMDPDGYPYLTKINYTYPGEYAPRYTDADLIDPPNTEEDNRRFKGKNKKKLFFDKVCFCDFVPQEYIGGRTAKDEGNKDAYDIVLDYGVLEYQDIESLNFSNAKFPIKVNTWGFVDGEIFSPIDDAISPQRLSNRIMSVIEGHLNNSGGSGLIIDEDSLPANGSGDVTKNIKAGKTVTLNSRGKGMPNTVSTYDNTPSKGVYDMMGLIPMIQNQLQQVTGVNEGLKGQSTGNDQLVGVTELLIQRGSLMQEPFYAAMTNVYIELYQDMANVGKRYYIDHNRESAIILGDEGAEVLTLSKDLRNEDFRVFITRENDNDLLKSQANQMLSLFLQLQLIDDKVFSNLYDRSTPSEVTMALRSQAGLRAEAKRRAEKEGQVQMQQESQMMAQKEEQDRQDKLMVHNDNVDLERGRQEIKSDETLLKTMPKE